MKGELAKQGTEFFVSNIEFTHRIDCVTAGIKEAVHKELKDEEIRRNEVVQTLMDKINRANASFKQVIEQVTGFAAYLEWHTKHTSLDYFGENPGDAYKQVHGSVLVVRRFGYGNYEHTPSLAIRTRDQTKFILTELQTSHDLRMHYERPSNGGQLGFLDSKTILDFLDGLATRDKCLDEMIRCLETKLFWKRNDD